MDLPLPPSAFSMAGRIEDHLLAPLGRSEVHFASGTGLRRPANVIVPIYG